MILLGKSAETVINVENKKFIIALNAKHVIMMNVLNAIKKI